MEPRRQRHLDEEPGDRRIEDDVGEERRARILSGDRFLDGHVELLLDDAGADGREADDERNHLEVRRCPEQLDRFERAHALVLVAGNLAVIGRRLLPRRDRPHDDEAHAEREGRDEEQVVRAEGLRVVSREARSDDTAQARAAADEPEQALGLARIEDHVRERPELANEEAAGQDAPEVEHDRHPLLAALEEQPEHEEQPHHHGLGGRKHPAARQEAHGAGVALDDEAHDESRDELDVGQVVGAKRIDELRSRGRLDDVVAGHRQE